MTRFALMILFACLPLAAHAQLYKCKRPDGSSTFQDTACAADASSTKIAAPQSGSAQSMTLSADSRGHFHTRISINNVEVQGVIDTGASMISISTETAHEMGISLADGKIGVLQTANGSVYTYIKVMPLVKVGEIDMYNVEVSISERSPTLIGMSVLKRFKISQENGQLILMKQW